MGAIIDKTKVAIEKVDRWGDFARRIFTEFDREHILQGAFSCRQYRALSPVSTIARPAVFSHPVVVIAEVL